MNLSRVMAVMVWLGRTILHKLFNKNYGACCLQWIDLQGENSLQEAMVNYNLR